MSGLTLALAKGRILEQALPLLRSAGIEPTVDPASTRELSVPATGMVDRLLIVRSADVPTYVEHGAAQAGIAGKDVLLEHPGEPLYEPLDLRIARCRLMVAVPKNASPPSRRRLRVATKYTNTTREYYAARGQQVELIKLYGSMELAPLVGMADLIVDLVDTGSTLKANGLEARDEVMEVSSRLIVNRAALKTRHAEIRALIAGLRAAVEAKPG